jgi:hypothetical protein
MKERSQTRALFFYAFIANDAGVKSMIFKTYGSCFDQFMIISSAL